MLIEEVFALELNRAQTAPIILETNEDRAKQIAKSLGFKEFWSGASDQLLLALQHQGSQIVVGTLPALQSWKVFFSEVSSISLLYKLSNDAKKAEMASIGTCRKCFNANRGCQADGCSKKTTYNHTVYESLRFGSVTIIVLEGTNEVTRWTVDMADVEKTVDQYATEQWYKQQMAEASENQQLELQEVLETELPDYAGMSLRELFMLRGCKTLQDMADMAQADLDEVSAVADYELMEAISTVPMVGSSLFYSVNEYVYEYDFYGDSRGKTSTSMTPRHAVAVEHPKLKFHYTRLAKDVLLNWLMLYYEQWAGADPLLRTATAQCIDEYIDADDENYEEDLEADDTSEDVPFSIHSFCNTDKEDTLWVYASQSKLSGKIPLLTKLK